MAKGINLKIQVLKEWMEWMKTTKGKTKGKKLFENNTKK
jgi:hypothetical protein